MTGLREVLLCDDCLDRHDEDCHVLGCECWCREDRLLFPQLGLMMAGLVVSEMIVEESK